MCTRLVKGSASGKGSTHHLRVSFLERENQKREGVEKESFKRGREGIARERVKNYLI